MLKWKGTYIELFGERLLLHERCIKDASRTSQAVNGLSEFDSITETYLKIFVLLDALKFNLQQTFKIFGWEFPINPFKHSRLKKKLTVEYFEQNLGIGTLDKYSGVVLHDLEGKLKDRQTDKSISYEFMIGLVRQYYNLSLEQVENMPVSEFTLKLEQSINYLNAIRGAKVQTMSAADEQRMYENEYDSIEWDSLNWRKN